MSVGMTGRHMMRCHWRTGTASRYIIINENDDKIMTVVIVLP